MTNEERDLISKFIARVAGQPQGGSFAPGSAPAAPLPPLDKEADALIATLFTQYPEARYRITQTALVQEAALAETQNRVRRLEWELQQAQAQAQQAPVQNKGFFGGLFGGGGQQQPAGYNRGFQPAMQPPPPQYPPNYQPGMFQQGGGSGFLGSALTTAAGVAGGMVVGNALMNAFSGHHDSGGGFLGGGGGAMASNSSPFGTAFDGAGVSPVSDPTAGFSGAAGYDAPVSDPFSGGGQSKSYDDGSFSKDTSYDQGGGDAFGGGGGGFDPGGFDDNT